MKKATEKKVKINQKCPQFKHGICLLTVDMEFHTRIPRQCEVGSGWCHGR
jgi:hypothetical protein